MTQKKLGVILLALLLAAMAMVPCVSAADEQMINSRDSGNVNLSAAPVDRQIPSDYPQNSKPAEWLSESDMINIVISQKTLGLSSQDKQEDLITIPVSYLNLNKTFTISKEQPSIFTERTLESNEGIVLVRMPRQMYARFIANARDGEISLPVDYFCRLYENSSDLYSHFMVDGNTMKVLPSEKYPLHKTPVENVPESKLVNPAAVLSSDKINSLLSYPQMFAFREYYNRIYSTSYDYCIGQITPSSWTLLGSGLDQFDVFQEREYRFNSNEAIEIVTKYRDRNMGGDIIITPALYRSGATYPITPGQWAVWGGDVAVDKNNLPHAFGYHVQFGGGYYFVDIEDMNTMIFTNSYAATAAAGTSSFTDLWGSSEYRQNTAPTTNTFSATTNPVIDEWAHILNGAWQKPNQVWYHNPPGSSVSYVSVTTTFDGSGNLITRSYGHYP